MIRCTSLTLAQTANDECEPYISLVHEVFIQAVRDARMRSPLISVPALAWLNLPETRELAHSIGVELPAPLTAQQLIRRPYPMRDKGCGDGAPKKTRRPAHA